MLISNNCSGSSNNLTTVWILISNSVDEKSLASIGLNPELKNILKNLRRIKTYMIDIENKWINY